MLKYQNFYYTMNILKRKYVHYKLSGARNLGVIKNEIRQTRYTTSILFPINIKASSPTQSLVSQLPSE